jgi:hypothetical protein
MSVSFNLLSNFLNTTDFLLIDGQFPGPTVTLCGLSIMPNLSGHVTTKLLGAELHLKTSQFQFITQGLKNPLYSSSRLPVLIID